MPKITNEVARAVRKATKLIPCCPCPAPRLAEFVEELEELVLEAVDVVVEDILRSLWVSDYRDMERVSPSAFARSWMNE
jgi:hypothetical protein